MEYIQPFGVEEGEVTHLKPSAPKKGKIELVVTEGGPTYLFRGRIEKGAAVLATEIGDNLQFDLAASPTGSAVMGIEGELGYLTVFAKKDTIGFLRFIEC